ncbi:phosphatidylinositol N-acetylglucosaminyltransferase subunit P [Trichinella spiralis]|nr:phosphatidylinositol N-acetylglucosaminyltransferase subunit P [Trichinella spiralis]
MDMFQRIDDGKIDRSPKPKFGRSVYGFVLLLTSAFGLASYLVWAFVPDSYLHKCNLTYLPDKYWALAIPAYIMVSFVVYELFLIGYYLINSDWIESVETVDEDFG